MAKHCDESHEQIKKAITTLKNNDPDNLVYWNLADEYLAIHCPLIRDYKNGKTSLNYVDKVNKYMKAWESLNPANNKANNNTKKNNTKNNTKKNNTKNNTKKNNAKNNTKKNNAKNNTKKNNAKNNKKNNNTVKANKNKK